MSESTLDPEDRPAAARPTSGIPRWVKVFAIIGLVLAAVVVILLLTGNHGPGRHLSAGLESSTSPCFGTGNGIQPLWP